LLRAREAVRLMLPISSHNFRLCLKEAEAWGGVHKKKASLKKALLQLLSKVEDVEVRHCALV
jgi:hypothetical protein